MTISAWLSRCLGSSAISLESAHEIGKGSGCQVWDCRVAEEPMVLKVYAPSLDDYSRLGPVDTARKHALALMELLSFGIPAPRCLWLAVEGEEAALVMEKMAALPFTQTHRVEAARVLARLHKIELADLSHELAALISRSTPNHGRVGEAPGEPTLTETTLQHGDYFSVNIIASEGGHQPVGGTFLCRHESGQECPSHIARPTASISVIDWDLLALGDPMWDLGHLLCADRGVTEVEAETVIAAYRTGRPVEADRLAWQRECWRIFWQERDITAERANIPDNC